MAPFSAEVSCCGVTWSRLATSFRNAWRVFGPELWVAAYAPPANAATASAAKPDHERFA